MKCSGAFRRERKKSEVQMRIRQSVFVLSAFAASLLVPAQSGAALILNSSVTSTTAATVFATWTGPDIASAIPNIGGPFWDIDLIASGLGTFEVTIVQHTVAAHAGEAPLGPALVLSFFGVVPGSGSAAGTVSGIHPPGSHVDAVWVSIMPTGPGVSSIGVHASHVPEPGTVGLFLAGCGLLIAARFRISR
jgi:hypothetical protein